MFLTSAALSSFLGITWYYFCYCVILATFYRFYSTNQHWICICIHIYNIFTYIQYIHIYYIILYYIVLYYIIFTYINIRSQCKWCELENKLNNNDKVIIKTRCTCYFLIIFRGLPLLFQNNVWISYMENFNLKRHILHINQWQSKLIPASKRAFESLQSFTNVLQNCRTSAISICY